MSNFPLYDRLANDVKNKDLTIKQKDDFVKKIKKIDSNGTELIYALIRVFQLEDSDGINSFKIPYGGTHNGSDIIFDLNDLPNKLKQILYKFIKIHHNTMKEESKLNENREDFISSTSSS